MWIVHVFPVPGSVLRPLTVRKHVKLTADSKLAVEYEDLCLCEFVRWSFSPSWCFEARCNEGSECETTRSLIKYLSIKSW